MDEHVASLVVDTWSRGAGVVARGPKMLLGVVPADRQEIERLTGRRTTSAAGLWRLEVGGRFLASDGVVYPGGVPFPEELHDRTAVISNEVWLYADDDGEVVGAYWWPDAVRRPIASVPRDDFPPEIVVHPSDAAARLDIPVPIPGEMGGGAWEPSVAVCPSRTEVIVFCTLGPVEPLNEMVVYENGGISVRATLTTERPDLAAFLRSHQPPYRRVSIGGATGVAREPGRSLGPQTWPWPGEVRWWREGIAYEVRGTEAVSTLVAVASSID